MYWTGSVKLYGDVIGFLLFSVAGCGGRLCVRGCSDTLILTYLHDTIQI